MPKIINGNASRRQDLTEVAKANFDYEYPQDLNLKPGTELHDRIVEEVLSRARDSHEVISKRFSSWNEIDRVLTAYVPLSEEEKKLKEEDETKPISIVFPYSYAVMETMLTYAMTALVQDPIFRYKGFSDDDTIGAILMEKKIQQDCIKHKVALSVHTMLRDCLGYGIGLGAPIWKERYGTRYAKRSAGRMGLLGRWMGRQEQMVEENALLYEGNALENIDPYMCLPDPHVSIHRVQDGDFFGWVEENSIVGLLEDEANDEDYFNVRYVKLLGDATTHINNNSKREITTTKRGEVSESVRTAADVIWMYINLIPEDWDLGDSPYPEKWLFGVAGDAIVVKAKPSRLNHGMYPVAAASPDFDGYSIAPMSRLEMLYGLQHITDFMFNSHVENVRKAINDMLVVDPFLLNMNDLANPKAGKLIRMRRPGWGKGVKDAVQQLKVEDITRQNVGDVGWIVSFMNHVSGVDEAMMGSLRQGGPERLTGTEFSGTRASAMSRMERMAMVISLQAMQDIGYLFASHTQQLMSQETYVSTAGEWEEQLVKEYGKPGNIPVSPFDISVDLDVVVRDGSTPGGQDSAAWRALFADMLKAPELAQQFDIVRIFKHVARTMGARNVDDFVRKTNNIQPQTMDNETVLREAEKGNMRPVGGM
jgi:hypothetical protein